MADQPQGLKKKILLADDAPDFVKVIKVRLEVSGYQVVTASNGLEALERVEREKPDAVLLDISMPGLEGLEVLRRIRRTHPALPVFVVTGYTDDARLDTAIQLQASGFIVKTGDLKRAMADIGNAIRLAEKYHQ